MYEIKNVFFTILLFIHLIHAEDNKSVTILFYDSLLIEPGGIPNFSLSNNDNMKFKFLHTKDQLLSTLSQQELYNKFTSTQIKSLGIKEDNYSKPTEGDISTIVPTDTSWTITSLNPHMPNNVYLKDGKVYINKDFIINASKPVNFAMTTLSTSKKIKVTSFIISKDNGVIPTDRSIIWDSGTDSKPISNDEIMQYVKKTYPSYQEKISSLKLFVSFDFSDFKFIVDSVIINNKACLYREYPSSYRLKDENMKNLFKNKRINMLSPENLDSSFLKTIDSLVNVNCDIDSIMNETWLTQKANDLPPIWQNVIQKRNNENQGPIIKTRFLPTKPKNKIIPLESNNEYEKTKIVDKIISDLGHDKINVTFDVKEKEKEITQYKIYNIPNDKGYLELLERKFGANKYIFKAVDPSKLTEKDTQELFDLLNSP